MDRGHISSLAEQARAHHIAVILGSILPVARYPRRPGIDPVGTIAAINAWMKAYAQRNRLTYVDYYSALQDSGHGFKRALTLDGVHPNPAGFAVMRPLAQDAVKRALALGNLSNGR
ncbi:MAG: GDSL-type esterase/lipase family protein [Candidatus Eremiobacteraeota bacterium]|nr:GDSL-type esterase/lipase family protein [Candidatus Eremiobacteraeota bacterium]